MMGLVALGLVAGLQGAGAATSEDVASVRQGAVGLLPCTQLSAKEFASCIDKKERAINGLAGDQSQPPDESRIFVAMELGTEVTSLYLIDAQFHCRSAVKNGINPHPACGARLVKAKLGLIDADMKILSIKEDVVLDAVVVKEKGFLDSLRKSYGE